MAKSIEQIKREHALLLESVEVTSNPFAVYDSQDRLIAWNQAYEAVHALAFNELRHRANDRRLHYADLVRVIAQKTMEPDKVEEHVRQRVEHHRRGDGIGIDLLYPGMGWFRVTKFRTRSGSIATFAVDINENKRREAELEQEIKRRMALEEQLRQQANTDPLTGLANRAALLERGNSEFVRARRFGDDLAVMMMDADHFKQVNDVHGHGAGDEVLRRLARTAAGTVRNVDLVGRLGGEEFAIILVRTRAREAVACAERIRACIAALEFESPSGVFHITASFGVTQAMGDDPSFAAVLNRADKALYQAKHDGRNQVACLDPRRDAQAGVIA
ncbi:MAG: diguanylate cyclase [Burkholderiaceae bacterium]|nr:diguanylate cyclase [Burkholderiaceae bacterium]